MWDPFQVDIDTNSLPRQLICLCNASHKAQASTHGPVSKEVHSCDVVGPSGHPSRHMGVPLGCPKQVAIEHFFFLLSQKVFIFININSKYQMLATKINKSLKVKNAHHLIWSNHFSFHRNKICYHSHLQTSHRIYFLHQYLQYDKGRMKVKTSQGELNLKWSYDN